MADYLSITLAVRYVDNITTAGLVRHLAENTAQTEMLLANLEVSLERHGSRQVAVVAHHDCAGNPVADSTQKEQVAQALRRLAEIHSRIELLGLWVDKNRALERIRPN